MALVRMFVLSRRLVFVLATLALGGRAAHGQAGPVSYWLPSWPAGFSSDAVADQGFSTYGNFPGFDSHGVATMRTNSPSGWFFGSEGGNLGLGISNLSSAFGNSLSYQGAQFGYKLQNSPVTFFGGVDTLKFNAGIGNPIAPFSNVSGTAGYSAHAGVQFNATPNTTFSLGVGYTQQSARVDSDINAPSLVGPSPFAFGRR